MYVYSLPSFMLGLLLNTLPAQPGHVAHITKRREPTREPIANVERSAVRGKHRGFSWDALSVTNATTCGGDKCYFEGERERRGCLSAGGRSSYSRVVGGSLRRSCERTLA